MYPHTITIYHRDENDWLRSVVSCVLWEEIRGRTMTTQGIQSGDSVAVYIPTAGRDVTLADGDVIVRGVCPVEVQKSIKEVKGLHVASVSYYDYGDDMEHMVVTAR